MRPAVSALLDVRVFGRQRELSSYMPVPPISLYNLLLVSGENQSKYRFTPADLIQPVPKPSEP